MKLFHVHPDLGEASSASLLSALSGGPREDPCSARRKDRKRWVVNREDAMLGTWREAALWKKQFTVMGICLESPHPTTKCVLAFFFFSRHSHIKCHRSIQGDQREYPHWRLAKTSRVIKTD